MSKVIDIADAVVAELNAAADETFSKSFDAVRKILPRYELSEMTELRVTVVPKAVETTVSSRATSLNDYQVDIGIQEKISKNLDADVVALCTLVQEISDYLTRRSLAAEPTAAWLSSTNDPIYVPEHLAENRLFTSVITLTYRMLRR